jgi:hypothetical protein
MPATFWGVWYTNDDGEEILVSLHTMKQYADSEKNSLQESNLNITYFVRSAEVAPHKAKLEGIQ